MRISDWSSDVCSSDLAQVEPRRFQIGLRRLHVGFGGALCRDRGVIFLPPDRLVGEQRLVAAHDLPGVRGRRLRAGKLRTRRVGRSEEHTSELQSLMRISYAVFCLKNKTHTKQNNTTH